MVFRFPVYFTAGADNDNIMIVLATNREGIGHPLLKWHRVIANTLLEYKKLPQVTKLSDFDN